MRHLIYGLFDPREPEIIRYVGYTGYGIEYRLQQHVQDAKQGKFSHKANWIRSLLKINITPEVVLIESVVDNDWQSRERYWIDFYGNSLTNGTIGGEGLTNPSQDVRDRISASLQGVSNGNQYRKGIPHTEESKRKIGLAVKNSESLKRYHLSIKGKPLTEATEAARLACTGVEKTEEHKRKISEAMKNSEAMKRGAAGRVGIKLPGASLKKLGSKFINNGVEVKQLKAGEPLPEGWSFGMKLKQEQ